MDGLLRAGLVALACTSMAAAAERLQPRTHAGCEFNTTVADAKPRGEPNSGQIRFPTSGRPRFIMRRLPAPEGAIDFRILGEPGEPAILSLIASGHERYADFTYDGSKADIDVGRGGLNLRPLDGVSSVNVWSMSGDTRLRVGSRDFRLALDFSHDGVNAYVRTTAGNVVMQSPIGAKAGAVFRGETVIEGVLRGRSETPASNSTSCTAGQIVWDAEYIYVCTSANTWKRVALATY